MSNDLDPVIVAALYEAAMAPDAWLRVLDHLHPLVNARASALLVAERSNSEGAPHQFARTSSLLTQAVMEPYMRDYAHYERDHVNRVFDSEPGCVVVDEAFDDRDSIVKRPDVAFGLKHLGIVDRFGVRLNDDRAWFDCIAFQYPANRGNVTHEEFARLTPYLPHIAQAVALGRMYDSIRRRYDAVLGVLNRIRLGILIVRDDGQIVLANDTAHAVVAASPHLHITRDGRLGFSNPDTSRQFVQQIEHIASTARGESQSARAYVDIGHGADDGDGDDTRNLILELSPLNDAASELETGFRGVLAMLIDPTTTYSVKPDVLRLLYDLTEAETHVARLLSDGMPYSHVAEHRNVERDTIKSQVSSIYSKMRTNSRAGFYRRLVSIALPFDD